LFNNFNSPSVTYAKKYPKLKDNVVSRIAQDVRIVRVIYQIQLIVQKQGACFI